jgi:predicted deacylase
VLDKTSKSGGMQKQRKAHTIVPKMNMIAEMESKGRLTALSSEVWPRARFRYRTNVDVRNMNRKRPASEDEQSAVDSGTSGLP